MLFVLGSVLDDLVRQGELVRNVVPLVDRLPQTKQEMQTYTPVEVKKVLAAARPDRLEPVWLLARQGDVAGARAAYQQAVDSGHADHAPAAAVNRGLLLARQGDVAGARASYQQAIDSGHAEAASNARDAITILDDDQGEDWTQGRLA